MYREYVLQSGVKSDSALTAAEHVDILTGFRIVDFNALTDFQQRIVETVRLKLEQFEQDNADILDTPLNSYSINGVSISFGEKVKEVYGVVIPADLYTLLCSSGLCYPAI